MTLLEISLTYQDYAAMMRNRISQLRRERKTATDPEVLRQLNERIDRLAPMLREASELERFTAHYYDRRYPRNAKYTV